MYKLTIPFFLSVALILSGCSGIRSSLKYTEGSECLYKGDYRGAIEHLEKAVQLDPTMSRNQNNLALAYKLTGNWDKAWYHSRQAVLCPQDNPPAIYTFWTIYEVCVRNRGLDEEGATLHDVVSKLGPPDIMFVGKEITSCVYGLCLMVFEKNKLTKCEDALGTNLLMKSNNT